MRKIIPILALLGVGLVVIAVALAGYFYMQFQPVSASEVESTAFVIPRGQATRVIASRLAEDGYIKNPLLFRLELKRLGLEDKLQSGSFKISPSMSLSQIAQNLTTGTEDIWITIPEGWRREEIAQSLSSQGELTAFNEAEFLELTASSEGMLFPDTYLVPKEATANSIFSLLTNTFETKVTQGLAEEFEATNQDPDDIIIMASLLEREARGYEEMRQVAGVLWTRMEIGMPLQVDATLQYAKGYDTARNDWWATPLGADRQLNSPFNTYQNPGLPPRPISNPGLDAIKAALSPAQSDNLFYIHDSEGGIHFAETLDQHNANINRYLR